ncbi:MAG: DEAD/DEAH box helicase family protein [Lachnospiraceae bacterium]|nr:DEAD/DEAH box helicase family protein [Lachnospiraceae bacterium]
MESIETNISEQNDTSKEKYEIRISVRTLVEFIMRSGDIDNRITGQMSKEAMSEGSRIHRKIQGQMGIDYKAEVPLKFDMEYDNILLKLEGRADGIISNEEGVTIDEIKGMYADVQRFKEPVPVHFAQAMCYAYMYGTLNHLEEISVQMTYCNLEDEQIKRFKKKYSYEEVREYTESIVSKYIIWAKYIAGEKKIRKESIKNLEFPFEYRAGQRNIVVSVYKTILQKKRLFIQAPTGVGKTISTIFPAVRAVGEEAADKIFYLTAKTITRTVAEEAFETLRKEGLHFKTITITAKDKICPNEEVVCNPLHCERAKGHFDRVNDAIFDILTHEHQITREVVEQYAKKHNVCPFEMSLDISNFMDGVICDYNYVFDPYVKLKRYFSEGARGDYVFLVDEAHNLVERAREMYSAVLVKEDILTCKKIVKEKSKRVYNALEKCNKEMLKHKRECVGEGNGYGYTLLNDTEELVHNLLRLSQSLEKFLDDNKEFEGREEVLNEYFNVRTYLDIYELVDENYVIYSDFNEEGGFFIKLFCVNPSGNLSQCMEQGLSTVFFSATLLPVNYYKELLSGSIEDFAIYIDSPFDVSKRLLAVARDVSSKYTRRNREEYQRILDYIDAVAAGCSGNYMVFFPSYKLMNDVYELAKEIGLTDTYDIICQFGSMNEQKREEFLNEFSADNDRTLIGFCVLGGIFSEGIDLKNDRLIGSIIVGTALPQICSEREILKNYYDTVNKNGFDYAYRYPGMNKVLQAAGRVIRTHEDFGVIALLDMRFLQKAYLSLFPREWADYKVTDIDNIGDIVSHFWKYV